MAGVMSTRAILGLNVIFCVTSVRYSPAQGGPGGVGAIQGTVVSEQGRPVAGALVYPRAEGAPRRGSQRIVTDKEGNFALEGLMPGLYRVFASAEDQGYQCDGAIYACPESAYPLVRVESGKVARDVAIRFGPKAARLVGTVVDSATGDVVGDARIEARDAADPSRFISMSLHLASSTFNILIPSATDVLLRASAPGYRDWNYGSDRPGNRPAFLRKDAGTTTALLIRLATDRRP